MKTQKTYQSNSKQVREQIRAHILDCVTDHEGNAFNSINDAAWHVAHEFNRVANYPWNMQRIPNEFDRFQDYMLGLPFSFEYEHWKIQEFLNDLGINPTGKEWPAEKSARLYFYMIWDEVNKAL